MWVLTLQAVESDSDPGESCESEILRELYWIGGKMCFEVKLAVSHDLYLMRG